MIPLRAALEAHAEAFRQREVSVGGIIRLNAEIGAARKHALDTLFRLGRWDGAEWPLCNDEILRRLDAPADGS